MHDKLKSMLRSFLTTFGATFLTVAGGYIANVVQGDFSWWTSAAVAGAVAALRTVIAYLDPGQPLYGNGSGGTTLP